MRFDRVKRPVTKQALERAERLIGCRLPGEYRRFLLKQNGGTPRPSGFTIATHRLGPIEDCVEGFYPIRRGSDANVERTLKLNRRPRQDHEHYEIHPDTVEIGTSMGGHLLLFVRGSRRGQIWLKDRVEDHGDAMMGMYILARGFNEFLRNLVPCEWDFPPYTNEGP